MAILHGIWLNKKQNSCLFIWGETWRSAQVNADISDAEIPSHPLAMTPQELSEWLTSRNLKIANFIQQPQVAVTAGRKRQSTAVKEVPLPSQAQIIALPTQISANSISPIHSAVESIDSQPYLHPWKVEGFCLQPSAAIKFLASLPLSNISGKDAFLSGDLRFWSQVARWSLDLIARGKFLPTIQRETEKLITSWQVLLDSAVDGTRLEKFSQLMPLGCRTYQTAIEAEEFTKSQLYVDLPLPPQELILGFLNSTIDVQVREMLGSQAIIEPRMMAALPAGVRQWLQGLTTESPTINADAIGVERLQAALTAWTLPLQYQLTHKALFRTCFELRSPEVGESAWKLIYYLQAADDPAFLVDAATIWQHPVEQLVYQNRTIEQPQETFMRGLGLASRLYPAIAPSLETEFPESLSLNPIQAYDFIKSVAWRLEDSGLGVVLPASLANREGWANRLGLKITAETPNQQQGRLGLQSLLNFQWKLAIGGQTISKAQFDRLVALNSPLVEINGEWVELRPQDIKTAQSFFASRKEKMSLSLEDALRLSTGDTQAIEKLPVVSFEASGALQELIGALTNNQAIAPLPTPANFKGELRPYQQRGAAWLAFLERWGLGACLADDMGLGKCVAPDTLVNINGTLCTAEEIWTNYASQTEFDGEGFWTVPTEKLIVNSLDTQTGKIVKAEVKHLYRQQIRETVRKITLQNGNSITITRRHQLLTHQGWTNNLKVGDYIAVPAKTLCNTQKSTITLAPLCETLSAPLRLKNFKPPTSITQTLEADSPIDLTQQSWQKLSHQQVLYSRIETIEDIHYQGWVYDLEVRKYHNFVANDIICHNTIQFIAFLLHLKEQDVLEKPTLLVCPTSVLGNWEREVKKFAPTIKILQYHGDKRPKGKTFTETAKKYNIVVTSYSLIHRDLKSLQTVDWQAIVLDEAQNVKNSDAKQSQAVRQLEATFRIALTGTPVENRLQELWSILDFLNPGYLGNKQFFQRRFAMPIEKYGDSASLNQLRSLVQPFILRRLKTDKDIIQDLPEKQEMTVFCGLSPEQATLYQKVVEESLSEIDTATGLQRRGMILALLIKLKQVCNHPAQYLKADSLDKYNSGKLQRLDEMLEEAIAEGDRALIFTQFAEWGKLLKPHLEKQLGREIFFLYGSTSKKQREEMIDRFQQDPQGPPIMILSLKAGGVGLNLTRANHVFHFDRWWNPAVENQATDRVFRIGQTRNVQVHKFVCTGTLEEKIHDMIESKKQLAEQVVGAGEDWLTELDTDQLRNLLLLDRSSVIEEDTE
ncbi:helicase [Calothrix sp. FACHB-1219]|uniref:SNF2-related protein n=1 Tax=unclassified Calothrix TaxID=2619626 RepID=UPI0016898600|nr:MULTISPECIES: SNF2-related protein [unclassified Calothrix]MBD2203598.1 helicase [Calothrix sp. FACHB-168]MBD2219904.1 helicase [Calothrix sp. FACHB-1219]